MKRTLTACYFAACLLSASLLAAQQVRIVAMTGDTMPRGDGVFTGFGLAVLGDSGEVAFAASGQLTGSASPTSMRGIYSGDGISPLRAVAQLGDLTPKNFAIDSLRYPAINAIGQVAYNIGTGRALSYLVKDHNDIVSSAANGDSRSDGPGTLSVNEFDRPHLANSGALTFINRLAGVSPRLGVFQTLGNVTTTIARDSELTPSGDLQWLYGLAGQASEFSVNTLGQVAVSSPVRQVSSGVVRNGLFLVDGNSVVEYPVYGSPVPGGDGAITRIHDPWLNDQQSVAFVGTLTEAASGSGYREGIFKVTGTELFELVRTGDPAPNGSGNFRSFGIPQLNAREQVLTRATFTEEVSPTNSGLVLADETGVFSVARAGTMVPDGSAFYTSVRHAALNDLGQVVFEASVGSNPVNGSTDGIFLYEDGDTRTLVSTGTPFSGSTITSLNLYSTSDTDESYLSPSRRTLNNLGQVAYRFTLADGREGIAVWSVPEVPASYLAIVAALGIVAMRPRLRTS